MQGSLLNPPPPHPPKKSPNSYLFEVCRNFLESPMSLPKQLTPKGDLGGRGSIILLCIKHAEKSLETSHAAP
jgi:hypothetical protein